MSRHSPAFLGLLALLVSCQGTTTDTSTTSCLPIAKAGAGQSAQLGSPVTLDGTKTEACAGRTTLLYNWSFEQVPPGSALTDASFGLDNGTSTATTVTFTPDVPGSYVVSLTVNDGTNASQPALVVITATTTNQPPVADAGKDELGSVGQRIVLDGSASHDPDGNTLTYQWSFGSLPAGSHLRSSDLFDPMTDHASFVPDQQGIYVASLVVGDGIAWSDPAFVQVTVASANQRPIADAGASQTLPPCNGTVIGLDGYGSYDPEGAPLTYQWALASAPGGSSVSDKNFDDPTKPNARFTWDVVGNYSFTLQVNDGVQWSAKDIVTYTVQDVSADQPPVANAGLDITINATATCTSASYVWTCGQCKAQKFTVDGSTSTDPDGDPMQYRWTTTDPAVIDSPSTAASLVHVPATDATYGTAKNTTYTLTLQVADCAASSTDTVALTVACTGTSAS